MHLYPQDLRHQVPYEAIQHRARLAAIVSGIAASAGTELDGILPKTSRPRITASQEPLAPHLQVTIK